MASTPPPYPPQDARWQARQMRDAAKAQRDQWKAQARAQREYYKACWRGARRPSFIGPVILLAIGILALLMETGRLDAVEFWSWYAHWWPMLLIGLGALLLGEYFLDWHSPWVGRRPIGGLVWLVIFMILLGFIAREGHLVGPFAWDFGDNNDNFWSWMGPEHDNDVQIDQALPAKPSVSISDPRGDVTITASTDSRMHLRAHQMVHRTSDDEARKMFDELKPKVETSSSGAVVTVPEKDGARVDLILELPPAAYATVTAEHGDVTADGLNGGIQVTDDQGDVKLEDIGADAQGHMEHGDFSAHNVQGKVMVDGGGDDVTLSEIQQAATINGEFSGDIHLEQITGPVHYQSSMTTLDIPKLLGSMTLDSSDLSITRASGPVHVVAKAKDIDLTQIAGDANIQDEDGDVDVTAASPLGNIQIADRAGNVILTMPEDANFSVTGSTSSDEAVRTDFPLQMSTQGDRQTLGGSVGHGGVKLELETDHGNLELRKGANSSLASTETNEPTVATAGAKHFKAGAGQKPVVNNQ
ncbi:MAG TPA: DUF4097 family beta strand repeat-containing protein [Acidobacteriaceae bacterium]